MDSHKRFRESLKLPFPLLSDPGGFVSRLYGILIEREGGALMSGRSVFLIDTTGAVEFADAKYSFKPGEADNLALMKAVRKEK